MTELKRVTMRESDGTREINIHQEDAIRTSNIRAVSWKKIPQLEVSLEEWKNEPGSHAKRQSFVLHGKELEAFSNFVKQATEVTK
jgi:hypothetical protein